MEVSALSILIKDQNVLHKPSIADHYLGVSTARQKGNPLYAFSPWGTRPNGESTNRVIYNFERPSFLIVNTECTTMGVHAYMYMSK